MMKKTITSLAILAASLSANVGAFESLRGVDMSKPMHIPMNCDDLINASTDFSRKLKWESALGDTPLTYKDNARLVEQYTKLEQGNDVKLYYLLVDECSNKDGDYPLWKALHNTIIKVVGKEATATEQ